MLRASQNNPCGGRGRGGDDGAEDAGDSPCAAAAVLEGLARRHNLCRGDAPRFISYSAAAQQGEFAAQRRCCVSSLISINADAAMA